MYSHDSAGEFGVSTVNVSAVSVGHSTPAARVIWSTVIPPECVKSVTVEFRTQRFGSAVATNTTTNTSQTDFIQTGLRCGANYSITVVVTGETSDGVQVTRSSRPVRVVVGGKEIVCMRFDHNNYFDGSYIIVQIYLLQFN